MTVLARGVCGSTIRGVVRTADGRVLAEQRLATGDGDPELATLHRVARHLRDVALREAGEDVRAVGVGIPEYVDPQGKLTSRDVLAWTSQPEDLLADIAPVIAVESDVRCAAWAEQRVSSEPSDFVVVSVGTGISHAVVRDGEVVRGARGEAIGLGQLPAGDPRAGLRPTIEEVASGAGLERQYRQRSGHSVDGGAREVVRLAGQGDADALDVLHDAGEALAYAAWVLVQVLDPARIVLTGGLGSADTPMHDRMRTAYADLTHNRPGAAAIQVSTLGDRAGLVGAEVVARGALKEGQ